MKKILLFLFLFLFLFSTLTYARTVRVKGHTTRSGRYVQPHYRTSPNHTKFDNWSTKGNVNPYTGKEGRVNP